MAMELEQIYDLMRGERRGPGASLARSTLWLAQGPYRLATAVRNWRFDRAPQRLIRKASVPVVSVGNVTTGGTGKTPMVEFIARWFRQQGKRVAIVSRGYGAEEGARNDEAMELERRLPDVPHLQNADRYQAARTAVEELESQLIVLDDGFQHRRLHRDLDLVLLDAIEPFGFGHLLPRGLLRESLHSLRRADAIVLSRAGAVDAERRQAIRREVERFAGEIPWIEAAHEPQAWVGDTTKPLSHLHGKRVVAFCGIGNPDGFRHSLLQCGCDLAQLRAFPDHHSYRREDIEELAEWARQYEAAAVVCTEKDWVKIQAAQLGAVPLWALRIGLTLTRGAETLDRLLAKIA